MPDTPAPLLDASDAMHRLGLGDDLDFYNELLEEFMSQAPVLLAQVQEATAAGRADQAAPVLHTFKGMALALSAHALTEFAATSERACRRGDLSADALRAVAQQLEELLTTTQAAMRQWQVTMLGQS